jgi:hypothetical protein
LLRLNARPTSIYRTPAKSYTAYNNVIPAHACAYSLPNPKSSSLHNIHGARMGKWRRTLVGNRFVRHLHMARHVRRQCCQRVQSEYGVVVGQGVALSLQTRDCTLNTRKSSQVFDSSAFSTITSEKLRLRDNSSAPPAMVKTDRHVLYWQIPCVFIEQTVEPTLWPHDILRNYS